MKIIIKLTKIWNEKDVKVLENVVKRFKMLEIKLWNFVDLLIKHFCWATSYVVQSISVDAFVSSNFEQFPNSHDLAHDLTTIPPICTLSDLFKNVN